MTDEEHDALHEEAIDTVDEALYRLLPEAACRASVLIAMLAGEIEQLDNAEDVQDVLDALGDIVLTRLMADHQLFNTAGSA